MAAKKATAGLNRRDRNVPQNIHALKCLGINRSQPVNGKYQTAAINGKEVARNGESGTDPGGASRVLQNHFP